MRMHGVLNSDVDMRGSGVDRQGLDHGCNFVNTTQYPSLSRYQIKKFNL